MATQTMFQRFQKATHHTWFSGSFALLRIALGVVFLLAGLAKFDGWSAAAYLESATGPFAAMFQSMAGSMIVDQLNIWGLTLIGAALILGLAVRPASFFGAVMMLLYYFAHFEQNTAHGYIDSHIIYLIVFVVFLAGGAGHMLGLDALVHRSFARRKMLAKVLFG